MKGIPSIHIAPEHRRDVRIGHCCRNLAPFEARRLLAPYPQLLDDDQSASTTAATEGAPGVARVGCAAGGPKVPLRAGRAVEESGKTIRRLGLGIVDAAEQPEHGDVGGRVESGDVG